MNTFTETSPSVLVVVNSPTSGLRRLGTWLHDDGVHVDERLGADGLPDSLQGYDGLVMLGGGLMPDEDVAAPWLPRERQLTLMALEQGIPLLGICLGAQVLAHVTGGTVEASSGEPERGSTAIVPTPEGRNDPLVRGLGEGAPMIENHRDRVTALGETSVLLASSRSCRVQAFRVGPCAWGVQFHPEVCAEDLAAWDEAALATQGFDLEGLIARARAVDGANTAAARRVSQGFARAVVSR